MEWTIAMMEQMSSNTIPMEMKSTGLTAWMVQVWISDVNDGVEDCPDGDDEMPDMDDHDHDGHDEPIMTDPHSFAVTV